MENSFQHPQDTKQIFRECGTCSRTFAHLLDRAFEHPMDAEERALDPLAGGIMNQGHQCGMLWGATLAVGAEALRRHADPDEAIAVAVSATQNLITSFENRTQTVNCREITGIDLSKTLGLVKFMVETMLHGMNNSPCFNLAEQWAPEAIQSGEESLAENPAELSEKPVSCASEVVRQMGGSEAEMVMVSGFAGGLGLSGNACGALSAAIWMRTLAWCKANPGKTPPFFNNPAAKRITKAFLEETGGEFLCRNIAGRAFESINDHSEFIHNGGCGKLMNVLANALNES